MKEGDRERGREREEFRGEGDSIDWAEVHPSFLYGPGKMSLPIPTSIQAWTADTGAQRCYWGCMDAGTGMRLL